MTRLRLWLLAWLRYIQKKLSAPTLEALYHEQRRENNLNKDRLNAAAVEKSEREARQRAEYMERVQELIEARQMAGSGPWKTSAATLEQTDHLIKASLDRINGVGVSLRETNPIVTQGAFGDIELALQNVEWRREVNLSWLEFSRWGIQQIILISRLHYIKNPIVRRLIDICAAYVFGRGVELSSPDEAANDVLKEFLERNKCVLGQTALANLHRRKYYDGNLFFACFADTTDKGACSIRTIDATEIQEIVTDPEDSDTPWFYRRQWSERQFNSVTGNTQVVSREAWYPALGFDPAERPATIGSFPVMWNVAIHHRKCGAVAKWTFGCPKIYPALDWAKQARKYLEACASRAAALAQIAMTYTTKGGQPAIEGFKQQMSTTVGPSSALWDINPPAGVGSTIGYGPGTKLEAFNTSGGPDPEDVRQYKLMCCVVVGVPETFLGDVKTGNLATATSLDRPTELVFIGEQEEWVEDLVILGTWALTVSKKAPSGKLREAMLRRGDDPDAMPVRESYKVVGADGRMRYEASKKQQPGDEIEVKATFPSIREGDQTALVAAVTDAMTLGNKGGQVVGIDEKAGVRRLYEIVGIEDGDELTEQQYPEGEYDPDRTKEPEPAPIPKAPPFTPGGAPQVKAQKPPKAEVEEALSRLGHAIVAREVSNGNR